MEAMVEVIDAKIKTKDKYQSQKEREYMALINNVIKEEKFYEYEIEEQHKELKHVRDRYQQKLKEY